MKKTMARQMSQKKCILQASCPAPLFAATGPCPVKPLPCRPPSPQTAGAGVTEGSSSGERAPPLPSPLPQPLTEEPPGQRRSGGGGNRCQD